jgi:Protein of unknown function (DUF3800)
MSSRAFGTRADGGVRNLSFSHSLPHLCGMPKRVRENRWSLLMKAFFDESGSEPHRCKHLIVAGFLAPALVWDKATDAWDKCLHEAPSIEYFKHDEATGLEGEFYGFGRPDADAKIVALAKVIAHHDLQGMFVFAPHRLFRERDKALLKGIVGSRVYDWGFFGATKIALQFLAENDAGNDKVDFVFDQRSELKSCISMYAFSKEVHPELMARAGTCIPGDDKETIALQMADLLAGIVSLQAEKGEVGEPWRIIAGNKKIAFFRADPPWKLFPTLAAMQMAKRIKKNADTILRRIYGDKEQSLQLIEDLQYLILRKDAFEQDFAKLEALYAQDVRYQEMVKKIEG